MYFDYGGDGQPGIRRIDWDRIEDAVLKYGPDTVLVLVKANPDVIWRRIKDDPHVNQVVSDKDIELILTKFQWGFERSRIANKLILDTSATTVEESLCEFLEKMESFMTEADRDRIKADQKDR